MSTRLTPDGIVLRIFQLTQEYKNAISDNQDFDKVKALRTEIHALNTQLEQLLPQSPFVEEFKKFLETE